MDILLVMAVVPAAVLLWYVHKLDPVEKEPGKLLASLLGFGALACIPAIFLEEFGMNLFLQGRSAYTISELVLENFIIIALSEELSKFFFLRLKTWKNPAFDFVFDGVVYAVFVSLGFAILENIGYVYEFGFTTAVVRAFTAIPGHAIFGVFMGCFYGLAKRAQHSGEAGKKTLYLVLAIVVPVLCHGFYDFCASVDSVYADVLFFSFLIVIMVIAMRLVKHMAKMAHPLTGASYNNTPYNAAPYSGTPFTTSNQYDPNNPYLQNGYNPNDPKSQ